MERKERYIYEDGYKMLKIPYSYENGRDTKRETLYDPNYNYATDLLLGGALTEDELLEFRDKLDKSFDLYGYKKKTNLRKQYNAYIEILIFGINASENKTVVIKVRKINEYFTSYINYVTTVKRLKETLKVVYADIKLFEEEVGSDFTSKLTCETKFL